MAHETMCRGPKDRFIGDRSKILFMQTRPPSPQPGIPKSGRRGSRALVALGVVWVWAQLPAAAQQSQSAMPSAPPKPAPRLAGGRVDFSGVWRPGDIFLIEDISLGLPKGETVPLKPSAVALMKGHESKDD